MAGATYLLFFFAAVALASGSDNRRTFPDDHSAIAFTSQTRREPVLSAYPEGGLGVAGLQGRSTIITFHWVDVGDGSRPSSRGHRVWMARKLNRQGAEVSIAYADRRNCPALGEVLQSAERLPSPRVDFRDVPAGERSRSLIGPQIDGRMYTFWGSGLFPQRRDDEGEVRVTGGEDSPIAVWGKNSLRSLASCWSSAPPCRSERCAG